MSLKGNKFRKTRRFLKKVKKNIDYEWSTLEDLDEMIRQADEYASLVCSCDNCKKIRGEL
jgi:hypothetical protein